VRHPGFFAMLWSDSDQAEVDAPRARRPADTATRRGARAVAAAEAVATSSRDKAMKRARRQGVTLWTA
jgi:hypothetical protein